MGELDEKKLTKAGQADATSVTGSDAEEQPDDTAAAIRIQSVARGRIERKKAEQKRKEASDTAQARTGPHAKQVPAGSPQVPAGSSGQEDEVKDDDDDDKLLNDMTALVGILMKILTGKSGDI